MYITRYKYGFPFVTKYDSSESPDYPPLVLAHEFKGFADYGIVLTEEGAGEKHFSYLLYVRIHAAI